MAIIKKIEHTYYTGRNHAMARKGAKFLIECDNPSCKKQLMREQKQVTRCKKNHYCSVQCQFKHEVGICSKDSCNNIIFNHQIERGSKGYHHLCHYHANLVQKKLRSRKRRADSKKKLFDLLGNKCTNPHCNQDDPMYLEIDHVHNDGAQHRAEINNNRYSTQNDRRATTGDASQYLKYLENNPNSLQILCANCNRAKQRNGGELYISAK